MHEPYPRQGIQRKVHLGKVEDGGVENGAVGLNHKLLRNLIGLHTERHSMKAKTLCSHVISTALNVDCQAAFE